MSHGREPGRRPIGDRLAQTEDVLRRAQDGDPSALADLVLVHLPDMRTFVRLHMDHRLRRREDESDIVQSACREILEGLPRFEFRGPGSFRAWMFTAVLNKVREKIYFHNAGKREIRREVEDAGDEDPNVYESLCSLEPSASQLAQGNELRTVIEAAMDGLTEQQRHVLLLSRVVGLSHEEIGVRLGISPTASRSLLARARVALLAVMEQRDGRQDHAG